MALGSLWVRHNLFYIFCLKCAGRTATTLLVCWHAYTVPCAPLCGCYVEGIRPWHCLCAPYWRQPTLRLHFINLTDSAPPVPAHLAAGMLQPTSGTAFIGGHDIRTSMGIIRQSLGICPQFDILWPDISVREHLQLYAVIKGATWSEAHSSAQQAAAEVRHLKSFQ